MFGLNDSEDKNQTGAAPVAGGNDLAAALDNGLASATLPPNDAAAVVPNPIVAPGSSPVIPTVPPESAIPPPPLEAVPSPAQPQENTAPLTAEATMSDSGLLDSFNLESSPAVEEPKKKKAGKKEGKSAPLATAVLAGTPDGEELLDIKQRALQSLTPLIDQLDQTAEEKFKTLMMLIQASDNSELVKEAYAAANEITDEKIRAQALLDVVNEINYFTQAHSDSESQD